MVLVVFENICTEYRTNNDNTYHYMAFLNGDTIELFGDPFTNDNFPQESDTPFRVCKNDDGTMTWMPGILL